VEIIEIDDTSDHQPSTSAQAYARQARLEENAQLGVATEALCDLKVFYKQNPSNRRIESLRERTAKGSLTSVGPASPHRERSTIQSRMMDALMKANREIQVIDVEDDD